LGNFFILLLRRVTQSKHNMSQSNGMPTFEESVAAIGGEEKNKAPILDMLSKGEIERPENDVIGGRYPSGWQKTEPPRDDETPAEKESRRHAMMCKPAGQLQIRQVYKTTNGCKRMKLRFDDFHQPEVWMEFDIDVTQVINDDLSIYDDDDDDDEDYEEEKGEDEDGDIPDAKSVLCKDD
jgi:hypothetical protein